MREMKDSGIEWIGKIPKDWIVLPIKYYFKIGRGRVISVIDLEENGKYPVYSSQTENNGCFGYINTYDYSGPAITWTTDGAKAGTVFYRDGKYNCTNVCGILQMYDRYKKVSDLKFLTYAIGMVTQQNKRYDINGFKIMSNEMANIKFAVPTVEEQCRIATYLDSKCTEIDNLTADIQKQIDTLEQYKKSVITEAVTKGLNLDVEMKDSGVEWIGEIPKEWKRKRLVHLISSERYAMVDGPFGSDMKNEEYVDEGVPIIQLTNIKPFNHYIDELKFITEEKHQQLVRHTARKGDIAIAKMMPAGRACILSEKYNEYVVAADAIRCVIDEDKADKRFVVYCLNSYCMSECEIASKGTTRVRISLDIARRLTICVPTLNYQIQIADYLDERCSEIDSIISDKKKQLETLEQYKKSLIYEYVTGKKEVLV